MATTSTRERFRAQVRDEIKQAALRQLAEAGPQGVSVNAIAKELGVSGPALYRYFASRDALLEELVADAYRDLAAAVAAASGAGEPRGAGARATPSPADRFRAFARAYRGWAVAAPHRYRLLYAPPLPGLDAHAEPIVDAAQEVMDVLLALLAELDRPALPPRPRALDRQLAAWSRDRAAGAGEATALRAVLVWSRLHGLVSLELGGSFASMGLDAERLFEVELAALLA